jgi:hypothetical protein
MWTIILNILKTVGVKLVAQFVSLLSSFLSFLIMMKKDQIQEKKKKKAQEFNKCADKVCNEGSLDDLLDLRRK